MKVVRVTIKTGAGEDTKFLYVESRDVVQQVAETFGLALYNKEALVFNNDILGTTTVYGPGEVVQIAFGQVQDEENIPPGEEGS